MRRISAKKIDNLTDQWKLAKVQHPREDDMKNYAILFGACMMFMGAAQSAAAEGCLDVTLTGTQGGPPSFNGLAGSGTLVRYGDTENNCSDVVLQFDVGRGTVQQLSKLRVNAGAIDGIFLTHIHSDHVDGLPDLMQLRWHFNSTAPKVDLVCGADATSNAGHTLSCANYAAAIGDAMIASGEIAQRRLENGARLEGGPAALLNVMTVETSPTPNVVWETGDVSVTAISSRHVPGHLSYRVDTPAGSVVIGGDAGNDTPAPPRDSSTSAQVETLAQGVDILVHSTIHPVMGPDGGTPFPPPIFFRQATATDLGSLAERAGVGNVMLTHLIPSLNSPRQGPFPLPNGPLTEADFESAVRDGGYGGNVVVGTDLVSLRITASD